MELKTLKDIDSTIDVNGVSDGLSVFVNDLKQEAIKWVKDIREKAEKGIKDFGMNPLVCNSSSKFAVDLFKHFFNLTEEDLN
jgi:hypothetical protein